MTGETTSQPQSTNSGLSMGRISFAEDFTHRAFRLNPTLNLFCEQQCTRKSDDCAASQTEHIHTTASRAVAEFKATPEEERTGIQGTAVVNALRQTNAISRLVEDCEQQVRTGHEPIVTPTYL